MANNNSLSNTVANIAANSSVGAGSSAIGITNASPNSYYSRYSWGYDDGDSPKAKQKSSNIELHLVNGEKIMLKIDWKKVYNLKELRKRTFKFTKKFPFLCISSFPYTTFRYRTHYEYLDSMLDPVYNVDCPLTAFMSLIGVDYEKFEDAVVEDAIKNGS